jgi:hypothetical protein
LNIFSDGVRRLGLSMSGNAFWHLDEKKARTGRAFYGDIWGYFLDVETRDEQ